jgi:hypothetical protein
MSSIWDSLHVRSPSVGIRDGVPPGLIAAWTFLSFASSGMMAVLLLDECVPLMAAHYREQLMEYDPPVASSMMARCT